MVSFPCEYLSRSSDVGVGDADKIRQYLVDRGKKWYDIQRSKKCYQFDGITTAYPRTSVSIYFQRTFLIHKENLIILKNQRI